MHHRQTIVAAIGLAASLLWGPPASAWNSSGHMLIALMAFERMDDAARTKALDLLRAHPRFAEHFERVMPKDVARTTASDKDRWYFAHAAAWPDMVRDTRGGVTRADVDRYSRPWWHFINDPIYLSAAEERQLASQARFNLHREPPTGGDDENMNIIQAVKNSAKIVRNEHAAKAQRAVHLCWLLHLAGDSHQPLHAVTLVTPHRFPKGDHGGNNLEIEHGWKLHAFWDDQVSNDDDFSTLMRLSAVLAQNPELTAAGEQAEDSLDIGDWMDESRELAIKFAYTPEVMNKVAEREGHSHLGPLYLSEQYRADAERLSERRAVEAAHRLAKLLAELLRSDVKPQVESKQPAAVGTPSGATSSTESAE